MTVYLHWTFNGVEIQAKLNVGGLESSAAFKDASLGRKFTVHL